MKRTSRRVRPNGSGHPQGFPWAKRQVVYHATMALDRVIGEGLKPRRMIGDIHATGGGPDESISFTLDRRIAMAIAIGLRTLARAARGDLTLGQMVIDLQPLAPKGVAEQLRSMQLTPEQVVNIDRGLVPFSAGMGVGTHPVSMDAFLSADRHDLHDVTEHSAGLRPYAARGWAAPGVVARMQEESARRGGTYSIDKDLDQYAANRKFEFYKYMLSYADWQQELYNPLFMHTDPKVMARVDLSQIGVVSATVGADWVCGEFNGISQLGYDMSKMWPATMSDWAHSCEQRLRRGEGTMSGMPKDWDPPTASETVYYTAPMAELRVYDLSLVRNLRREAEDEDVVSDVSVAWFNRRGREIEDPLAYPYFRARHPQAALLVP